MDSDTEEACRLLFECLDELRLHETEPGHRTPPDVKRRAVGFLMENGLTDPWTEALNKVEG